MVIKFNKGNMIELAKANPDPETLKVLLLLGIIGYFVKEKISSQRKELEGIVIWKNKKFITHI